MKEKGKILKIVKKIKSRPYHTPKALTLWGTGMGQVRYGVN